jgi:hypothetical protein
MHQQMQNLPDPHAAFDTNGKDMVSMIMIDKVITNTKNKIRLDLFLILAIILFTLLI